MATYYMRADGTAANKAAATGPSSVVSACMNVSVHNGETFSAGDTIIISDAGGVYRATLIVPSSGALDNPITYLGEGAPVLSGANVVTDFTDIGSNQWTATVTTEPKHMVFDGVLGVRQASAPAVAAEYDWFWTANTLTVFSTVDPDSAYALVEAGARNTCITDNDTGRDYVTFRGLTVRGWQVRGIDWFGAGTNDLIVENCTCELGGSWSAESMAIYTRSTSAIVRSTTIRNAYSVGVYFDTGSGQLCEDCSMSGLRQTAAATNDSLIIWGTTNCTVRHLVSDKTGLTVDGDMKPHILISSATTNSGTTVEDCTFIGGAAGIGIGSNLAGTTTIRRNWFQDLGNGASFQSAIQASDTDFSNLKIYRNVVTDFTESSFRISDSSDRPTGVVIAHNTIYHDGTPNQQGAFFAGFTGIIENNVFYVTGGNTFTKSWYTVDTITSDYNCFGPERSNFLRYGVTDKSTLADYRAAAPDEDNSIATDPLFVNAAGGDFHLKSNSPCKDVGVLIQGINY